MSTNRKRKQEKLSEMEYDILRVMEEGIDDILSIIADVATMKDAVPLLILDDFFRALNHLLCNEYISFGWSTYQYADEKELLNHLEVDQVTGDWKWNIAMLKNRKVNFMTLQGTRSDHTVAQNMKKSLYAVGVNFLDCQNDIFLDSSVCIGLSLPKINLRKKGVEAIAQWYCR